MAARRALVVRLHIRVRSRHGRFLGDSCLRTNCDDNLQMDYRIQKRPIQAPLGWKSASLPRQWHPNGQLFRKARSVETAREIFDIFDGSPGKERVADAYASYAQALMRFDCMADAAGVLLTLDEQGIPDIDIADAKDRFFYPQDDEEVSVKTLRTEYERRRSEMPYRPKLDPKVDLAGATPEKLVRALFRRVVPLRPGRVRKAVAGDEVTVEEVPANESGDGVPHLDESV